MEKMIHLAIQYLATVSKSFLEPKADDSHTNLGFSLDDGAIYSRMLDGKQTYLCLSYKKFSLEWITNKEVIDELPLDGKTHKEIVTWINEKALASFGKATYTYDLHYELPYDPIQDDFTFVLDNKSKLDELVHCRILAQLVLEDFLKKSTLVSDIRIWPHHFDTGAFATLPDHPEIAIGLGLAIPDSLIDDHYFYIAAYRGHDSIQVADFKPLQYGKWVQDGFTGAVLGTKNLTREEGLAFFLQALATYTAHLNN